MGYGILFLLAVGLSMDAFAVSMTNGMCYRMPVLKNALSSGVAFGLFQGAMPLAGYFLGASFSGIIQNVDHWLALLLLCFIGGRMIQGAIQERRHPEHYTARSFSLQTLLVQSVATSIDALAVGVSLGALGVNVLFAVSTIALVTFLCCFSGVFLGDRFGRLFKDKAEFLGGLILVFIGLHIFIEHMEWVL